MRFEKLNPLFFSLALCAALLAASVANVEARIYKWVDAQGNVHFGERAPTGQKTEVVKTRRTHITDDEAKDQLKSLTEKSTSSTQNNDLVKNDQAQEDAVVAKRNENCEIAQKNLALLQGKNRVQAEGKDGAKFYLDEQAKQHKLDLSKKQIAEFCG
ncbi:MAG: DUF4124 domain-containing protein [Gammaproteobacteria bacterium]|nr:DUF4124 domain-containing protein [Gammaproteobacteria bacterium]